MPKERIIQSERMRKRLNKIIEEGISTKSDASILDGLIKRAIAYIVTKTLEELNRGAIGFVMTLLSNI